MGCTNSSPAGSVRNDSKRAFFRFFGLTQLQLDAPMEKIAMMSNSTLPSPDFSSYPSPTPQNAPAVLPSNSSKKLDGDRRDSHMENLHPVNLDIKVHTVVSADLDYDHVSAMKVSIVLRHAVLRFGVRGVGCAE
jgi:hypothetical protein